MLRRIYGKRIDHHNYATTLASVAFAGTIVGMLVFGYLSDKIGMPISAFAPPSSALTFFPGRKFGMVSTQASRSLIPIDVGLFHLATPPWTRLKMTATGIVAFFSALSAASSGAHGSLSGMLSMLIACR